MKKQTSNTEHSTAISVSSSFPIQPRAGVVEWENNVYKTTERLWGLRDLFGTGEFAAVDAVATVLSTSSLRDVQGIGIVPAISPGASSAIVQSKQLL